MAATSQSSMTLVEQPVVVSCSVPAWPPLGAKRTPKLGFNSAPVAGAGGVREPRSAHWQDHPSLVLTQSAAMPSPANSTFCMWTPSSATVFT